MPYPLEAKVAVLQSCLTLPQLNDYERSLLRSLVHSMETGETLPPFLATPVRTLFAKIENLCSTR